MVIVASQLQYHLSHVAMALFQLELEKKQFDAEPEN